MDNIEILHIPKSITNDFIASRKYRTIRVFSSTLMGEMGRLQGFWFVLFGKYRKAYMKTLPRLMTKEENPLENGPELFKYKKTVRRDMIKVISDYLTAMRIYNRFRYRYFNEWHESLYRTQEAVKKKELRLLLKKARKIRRKR